MSNNNNLKLVSPVAPCKWVNIKTPHPEYEVYQINLLLPADSEEAKKWMEDIDGWMADEMKASGSKKITEYPPYKEDGGNRSDYSHKSIRVNIQYIILKI